MGWFSKNDQGLWCNFCGEHLATEHELDDEVKIDLEDGNCNNCGAPDDIDPDAI